MSVAETKATYEETLITTMISDPKAALEIALAEANRERAIADRRLSELREQADVAIDEKGNFRPRNLAGLWRLGQMYSRSALVPDHYKGKPDDCAIGVQMALRCGVDILTFLQSSYIVHGKPGIEAKLAIAMINSSGQIKGRIRWKFEGEGKTRQCTAIAIDALTGESLEQTVTWAIVEAEGWTSKNGSKWKTIPDLMFQYRSAAWLARTNFPDVLMGMYMLDELDDMPARGNVIDARPAKTLDDLAERLIGKAEPGADLERLVGEPQVDLERPENACVMPEREAINEPEAKTTATEPAANEKPLAVLNKRLKSARSLQQVGEIEADIAATYKLTPDEETALAEDCEARREQIREEIKAAKGKA